MHRSKVRKRFTLCENETTNPGMDEAAGFVKPFTSIVSSILPILPGRLVFYPHFMIVASETQKGDGTGLRRSHCWRIRGENGGKGEFSWLQPPERVTGVRLPRCSSSDSRAPFISLWIHNSLLDTSFWMHCWQFHVF